MFKIFGQTLEEFLASADKYGSVFLQDTINSALEHQAELIQADEEFNREEIVKIDVFVEEVLNVINTRNSKTHPTRIQLYAYEPEYGFIASGGKVYPFVTLEQCRAQLTRLYKANICLKEVELVGRCRYEGTSLVESVSNVIESLK